MHNPSRIDLSVDSKPFVEKSKIPFVMKNIPTLLLLLTLCSCAMMSESTIPVLISTNPSGAELYIDDKKVGITPSGMNLMPSSNHKITIKKEKFNPVSLEVEHKLSYRKGNQFRRCFIDSLFVLPIVAHLFDFYRARCSDFKQSSYSINLTPESSDKSHNNIPSNDFQKISQNQISSQDQQRMIVNQQNPTDQQSQQQMMVPMQQANFPSQQGRQQMMVNQPAPLQAQQMIQMQEQQYNMQVRQVNPPQNQPYYMVQPSRFNETQQQPVYPSDPYYIPPTNMYYAKPTPAQVSNGPTHAILSQSSIDNSSAENANDLEKINQLKNQQKMNQNNNIPPSLQQNPADGGAYLGYTEISRRAEIERRKRNAKKRWIRDQESNFNHNVNDPEDYYEWQ